jgi:aminoglycoside 6'-N-acetyltransferase
MDAYSFRCITSADLPMVRNWLETPSVREWWVDANSQPSQPFNEEDLQDSHLAMWIVSHHGNPFAFIQDYDPHAWAGHHFGHLPPGSRGIDQFIGEPVMFGRGYGSAFARSHVDALMARGAAVVGTDPRPDNVRAIRAYEKAGFVRHVESETQWGICLLMTRYADNEGASEAGQNLISP